jgi:glycosyltransferase involved in cell wall biosynthesis
MQIIMLTPYLPFPPHAGGRIRMLELLRFLQPRHEITVVSFIFKETEYPFVSELSKFCKNVITVMRHKQPLEVDDIQPRVIREYWTPEMRDCLQELNSKNHYDLLDVEHIFMAQYAPLINAPAILQEHNIESQVLRRYAEWVTQQEESNNQFILPNGAFHDSQSEWVKMASYENYMWPKFPVRLTVSDLDREEMVSRCSVGQVLTIPNGVNTKTLQPVGSLKTMGVLFTGTLDYQPNIDAVFELCDLIWPHVQHRIPNACLYIVGRKPPTSVLMRHKDHRIEIFGDAPDISFYAAKCSAFAVPLRNGGGTRLKILTALALGLPVVTTTIGCEGLNLIPGHDVLVSDDPLEFSEFLIYLLKNKKASSLFALAGRTLVEERFDWSLIFPKLEQTYLELVE